MFSVSPTRFCTRNLLTHDKANGPISKRPVRLTGRHHNRSRQIIRRAEACGSCQELPPYQQARYEVQWCNTADECESRDICTLSTLSSNDASIYADRFPESDGGWDGMSRRASDVSSTGAAALLFLFRGTQKKMRCAYRRSLGGRLLLVMSQHKQWQLAMTCQPMPSRSM